MATNYWTAASAGNWNTSGNWSLGHIPTTGEDVVFDSAHSVAGCTMNYSSAYYLGSLTLADSYTGSFTMTTGSLFLSGNLYIGTGTVFTGAGTVYLYSNLAPFSITCNGAVLPVVQLMTGSQAVTLLDAFACTNFTIASTLLQNGKSITCNYLTSSGTNSVFDSDLYIVTSATFSAAPADSTGLILHPSNGAAISMATMSISRLVLPTGGSYHFGSSATKLLTILNYTTGDWDNTTWRATLGYTEYHIAAPPGVIVTGVDVAMCENDGETIDATDVTNTDNGLNIGWTFTPTLVSGAVAARVSPDNVQALTADIDGVLFGNHFGTTTTIDIGGSAATIVEATDALTRFKFPSLAVGTYDLVVTNPVNGTSDTLTDAVTFLTPGTPILANAEAQLKILIEGMSVATGYNYDWGTATIPDEALGTELVSLIESINPFETNIDDPDGAHSGAYLNECQYRITVRPKLESEETYPDWEVRAFWHRAVDDLKRCFGVGDGSTLNGVVQYFHYQRTAHFIERAGDVFKPGRIEVYFGCLYHQDRMDPSKNA